MHRRRLKIVSIALIALVGCPLIGFHIYNTSAEVLMDAAYNSRADITTYEAGVWLSKNYPDAANVVVTLNPGAWFAVFSEKPVIAQTYDWEGANSVADSILTFDYQIEAPQTMLRAYEPIDNVTDETYVSLNQLWRRVSYSSLEGDFLSFTQNGVDYTVVLSELSRTVLLNEKANGSKTIEFSYFNHQVALTQTLLAQNDQYPLNISWSVTPLTADISNVTLSLVTSFDHEFHFDKAQIPGFMDWTNPWDMPSKIVSASWVSVDFSSSDMHDYYIGLYDQEKQTAFAMNFTDLPTWGNIGAIATRQIDAIRYQYQFEQIRANQNVSRQYQVLALTKDTYPSLQPEGLPGLFSLKASPFPMVSRSYKEYLTENNIRFIVYDQSQFDYQTNAALGTAFLPELAKSPFLHLVYQNSRYDIFEVLGNYNQLTFGKTLNLGNYSCVRKRWGLCRIS
ncbi:MAG: hypothetical protein NWE93_13260 [Candidatus Bathyarchaeota archaeon]|nr:hypothetical protein [Candidatus Bathyarchaeota archaeon]